MVRLKKLRSDFVVFFFFFATPSLVIHSVVKNAIVRRYYVRSILPRSLAKLYYYLVQK